MSRWSNLAGQRLRDSEHIQDALSFGENGVVVTDQRLLVFVPENEGANYRAIERPNVEGVSMKSHGEASWLEYMGKGALAGLAGVVIGVTMDFGSLLSVEDISADAAGQSGMGGMMQILNSISRLLNILDDALLVGGLLAFSLGLGAFGLYIESRQHGLWITVAGEEEAVQVPAPKGSTAQFDRLEGYLDSEPQSEPETEPQPQDDPLRTQPE